MQDGQKHGQYLILQKKYGSTDEGDLPYEDEAMRAHAKEMVFPIGEPNDAFAQYFIGNSYLSTGFYRIRLEYSM